MGHFAPKMALASILGLGLSLGLALGLGPGLGLRSSVSVRQSYRRSPPTHPRAAAISAFPFIQMHFHLLRLRPPSLYSFRLGRAKRHQPQTVKPNQKKSSIRARTEYAFLYELRHGSTQQWPTCLCNAQRKLQRAQFGNGEQCT